MKPTVNVKSNKGTTVLSTSIDINLSKGDVWEILKFPGKIEVFHPLIKKSYMTSGEMNGVGAKRHCDLLPMGEMDEVITEWNEGHSFCVEVTGGKMLPPYHFMRGRLVLKESGSKTTVSFSFSYRLKYGVIGRLMDVLLIRPQFKKAPSKYVEGLKNYVENKEV